MEFDKDLGVYKIYKGYKYQPGPDGYSFKSPGKKKGFDHICLYTFEDFKKFIDEEISNDVI